MCCSVIRIISSNYSTFIVRLSSSLYLCKSSVVPKFIFNRSITCRSGFNSCQMDSNSSYSDMTKIEEGQAKILNDDQDAFYNPIQTFNRDISIAVIKQFIKTCQKEVSTQCKVRRNLSAAVEKYCNIHSSSYLHAMQKGFTIFEGLSATGLRSIRYALELPKIKAVIANDNNPSSFKCIERNIEYNKIGHVVQPHFGDARMMMYDNSNSLDDQFQVVDIDPYGSPAIFLDAAVQSVSDGGLLCITCTDMAVLCGNHAGSCFAKYGSVSLRSKHCHEMALRIALSSIESNANRYGRYIVPLLSVSVDYYIRVFVRVFYGKTEVNRSASKKSFVFQCTSCDSFYLQPLGSKADTGNNQNFQPAKFNMENQKCTECDSKLKLGGPIWSEPIHDLKFTTELLKAVASERNLYKTSNRIIGLLSVISEEIPDQPLYYVTDSLANSIHSVCIPFLKIRSALLQLGYKVSSTHAHKSAFKTDASNSVVWDVMRCWAKKNPVSKKKLRGPGEKILQKEPSIEASFDILPGANPESRKLGLVRYQVNPEPNWGPKSKVKKRKHEDSDSNSDDGRSNKQEKSISNKTSNDL
ncbi:tRNA (guanine(26)-N(2))-dimethyltransferase [Trichoplax sp. H2]|nr:tRNA (guanine(26)-N(2))-dimethyltransferase [Trichoplax sp. H2]|eukprot:RDD42090.1 tRNA (guanine(26)-N(2))-dimethyltransferase [Trichoplax sp. H2]